MSEAIALQCVLDQISDAITALQSAQEPVVIEDKVEIRNWLNNGRGSEIYRCEYGYDMSVGYDDRVIKIMHWPNLRCMSLLRMRTERYLALAADKP